MADINIRGLVIESLVAMEKDGTFLTTLEQAVLDKYDHIDSRDKAFYKRVLSGTIERKIRIDYILGLFSGTPIRKMKPYIRAVLRSSIYQIMWMDSVPDSAVCNEAVKFVSSKGLSGLKGFVNGVLRNICRNKDNISYPQIESEPIKALSVIYSCPEWIVDKVINEYGFDAAKGFLEASMEERPICVRMRVPAKKAEQYLKSWQNRGIEVKKHPLLDYAYTLRGCDGVGSLEGYNEGAFIVQDVASMMVADKAGIKKHDIVMDVCAAPGGKSIHAADILAELDNTDKGLVYSYDISEEKCDRIRSNVERLGISNIKICAHDAAVFIPEMECAADVVIVDAPCSGIGVIGHKSDIKYRLEPNDIEALAKIQRNIIDTAVRYVKPGGRLVYSTCTISKQENSDQKEYILSKYPFKQVILQDSGDMQLIPGRDDTDGFYIAVFEKEKE